MLRYLGIRQFALIDALEVEFGPGLNVLTGETGAGKSVVVEAVDLLLGGRASSEVVRTGADAAVVQAVLDLPAGGEAILRREVSASGRSRAFVDGDLVTSAQLRQFTGPLIDLHGQHDHQTLLAPQNHLALLDAYAHLEPTALAQVAEAFEAYRRTRDALDACRLDDRDRASRLDVLQYQIAEIDKVRPLPGEDEDLGTERRRLANADRIQRLAADAYATLYESDSAVIGQLERVWKRVGELAALDPSVEPCLAAHDPIRTQLEDISLFLRSYLNALDASPERLQQVEDRLALLERLKRRYGPTLHDVTRRRDDMAAEAEALATSAERASALETELRHHRTLFIERARTLSTARRDAARRLRHALAGHLAELAMPGTTLEVRFDPDELPERRWSSTGRDAAEFFFSANPGEVARPLARVASGGELSRVMLALKTLATTDAPGKTLIFDEVDAGIGGRVADTVGQRLAELGASFQVLCITHLPQVAAHAHAHYRVSKRPRDGRAVITMERLQTSERVEELARMIGGERVTASVTAGAREMLASRAKGEPTAKGESETAKARGRR